MATVRGLTRPSAFSLHARQLQQRIALRKASTTTPPPKPRLLEKPEKFNPPSHGQRLKTRNRVYGAPLSEQAREAQKTRQYPHMMPPDGTWLRWFLTNRMIHAFITLGILLSLVFGTWFQNFIHTTIYRDLLPPNSMFFAHPFRFIYRYFEVYNMHTMHKTQEVMAKRKATVEDVQKRADYRKAHGLDQREKAGWFGGWTAKTDEEMLGPGIRTGAVLASVEDASPAVSSESVPPRKRWLGIW